MSLTIPSLAEAEAILEQGYNLNPGPWAEHSRNVAKAARSIADHLTHLDAQTAYILGLLHDIGRRVGVTGMRHVIDGYRYLVSVGYADSARICMTHSYPVKSAAYGSSEWDGSEDEYKTIQAFLDQIEYNDYDRLIQLCDSLVMHSGPVLMEKRLLDVVLRYGFNEHTLRKWKAFFEIKAEFEGAIGRSIYSLLPGVVENTFNLPG